MNPILLIVTLASSTLIAGCGGAYEISRTDGGVSSRDAFNMAERACNSKNFFVTAHSDDPKQTIYITEKFRECMASKGWNYSRTERKFWPAKSVSM